MAHVIKTENSIICQNRNSLFRYFAWPSVAKLPDGVLAMVCSGFRLTHVCPFGKGVICYSRDNGRSWTAPAPIIDTPLDDRDCGIAVYDTNKVIVTSFNNTVASQRETAANYSSEPERSLRMAYLNCVNAADAESHFLGSTYTISRDGGYTFGDIGLAPVTSPHGPCELPDHSLLYVGRELIGDKYGAIKCYRMTGDGAFEYLSTIEEVTDEYGGELINCEPHAVILPSGKIIVHIRLCRDGDHYVFDTYQCESIDGGKSFTSPHRIPLEDGAPSHLLRHSSGMLIATYGRRIPPYGQRVVFSTDEGESWSEEYILRSDGPSGDLGYPATVELDDGSLLSVYYQQETDHSNTVIMQSRWQLPAEIR